MPELVLPAIEWWVWLGGSFENPKNVLLAIEFLYQLKLMAKSPVASLVYEMAKDRRFDVWVGSQERFCQINSSITSVNFELFLATSIWRLELRFFG